MEENKSQESTNTDSTRDSKSRLDAIINTAIDGIITIDERGIIESINPAALKLFGYSEKEVLGKNVSFLMPNPYQKEHDKYLQNYMETGVRKIIGIGREVTGMRKDSSTFPVRLAVSETWLDKKRIFTGIVHDLTEVKKAEEEAHRLNQQLEQKVIERTEELAHVVNRLLKTNVQLENEVQERKNIEDALLKVQKELTGSLEKEKQLNELKSRFVSMASHEFRTPLSTILSSVSLIGRYIKEEQQPNREKHIDRIKSAVTNLTGILNDFLSLSKLEEGKMKMMAETCNLGDICQEVKDEVQGLLKTGQKLRFEVNNPDLELFLDRRHLKNILLNLLSNAIKYSEEGQNIFFRTWDKANMITFEVEDEGIGIPEEDQEHLFSRFFRAHNAINIQGTGLGLNIVKRYVEMLSGSLAFESEEGKGSTFRVTVPVVYNE
jgi:two-component system sensor kinase FixL